VGRDAIGGSGVLRACPGPRRGRGVRLVPPSLPSHRPPSHRPTSASPSSWTRQTSSARPRTWRPVSTSLARRNTSGEGGPCAAGGRQGWEFCGLPVLGPFVPPFPFPRLAAACRRQWAGRDGNSPGAYRHAVCDTHASPSYRLNLPPANRQQAGQGHGRSLPCGAWGRRLGATRFGRHALRACEARERGFQGGFPLRLLARPSGLTHYTRASRIHVCSLALPPSGARPAAGQAHPVLSRPVLLARPCKRGGGGANKRAVGRRSWGVCRCAAQRRAGRCGAAQYLWAPAYMNTGLVIPFRVFYIRLQGGCPCCSAPREERLAWQQRKYSARPPGTAL
jgi:hypothetical protein